MSLLQGKGIWTLYDDIDYAVSKAPEAGAQFILCKVSKHGRYSPNEAKKALAKVRKKSQLVPVAWTYSYLDNVAEEVECIRCALRDGFAAVIVEAGADLNLKFKQADEFVDLVQKENLDLSQLFLCTDARVDTKADEIPVATLAKACQGGLLARLPVDGLPAERKEAAARAVTNAYEQVERQFGVGFSLPLMPVLASFWDSDGKARMTYPELKGWAKEVEARQPSFVSLYRAGVTAPEAWQAFKEMQAPSLVKSTAGASHPNERDLQARSFTVHLPVVMGGSPAEPASRYPVVPPGGSGYQEVFYPPHQPGGWKEFTDKSGYKTRYRSTSKSQTMYASYLPSLPEAGRYMIETFIPGQHATTKGARYFITYYEAGVRTEKQVVVNQLIHSDYWVALGPFELDPTQPEAGRVNLVDLTADDPPKEIAFSAIRWRPVAMGAYGFDSPVGTEEERASSKVWPGHWYDANPYLTRYSLGYHTGADLNLSFPHYDADRGKPVYSIADGEVVYAQVVPNSTWNGLVVIRHGPLPDGRPVYSRYAHVENIPVKPGDVVTRGQQVGQVGLFGKPGTGNYHLHFDISTTNILEVTPWHWPKFNLDEARKNYVDPRKFIQDHRP